MDSHNSPSTKPLYRSTQIIWYLLSLLNVLLGFRFILKLMDANSTAGFTAFIYKVSQPFASPFLNVFRVSQVEGSIIEWTTLLAMLVYSLVALSIVRVFFMSKTVSTHEAAIKLNKEVK